ERYKSPPSQGQGYGSPESAQLYVLNVYDPSNRRSILDRRFVVFQLFFRVQVALDYSIGKRITFFNMM
ncbi:MAG: hypothetical protein ILP14_00790, partial [Oscillospiraceae bacterium]|nr:hypothetical protein [Oscillospiraceae bacterium]